MSADDERVEPAHDGGAQDLVAQDAAAPHVLQFRSPVYVARWIDDRHVIIGGGGNNRFGMTNGLALLSVDPVERSPSVTGGKPQPLWRFCGSVDLRGNILFCMSNLYYPDGSDTAPTTEAYVCVSHLDSFSLIHCRGLQSGPMNAKTFTAVRAPSLAKICRVGLQSDGESGEPDKKPVTIARGVVFAGQDDGTIAVFRLSKLTSPGSVVQQLQKLTREGVGNESFTSFSSASDSEVQIDASSRLNDITARAVPWDNKSVFVFAACKDKKARIFQFNVETMSLMRKIELSDTSLGFKAGTLLRSSLRVCTAYEQQLPVTDRLSAPQKGVTDPRKTESADDSKASVAKTGKSNVNVSFLLMSLVEGVGYVQRVIMTQLDTAPKVDQPISIGKEAPTSVTHSRIGGGVRFTSVLVGTAEGTVLELLDGGMSRLARKRVRKMLHQNPISAIALNAAGGVVSTDIAQRIVLSWCGTSAAPRTPAMRLFSAARFPLLVALTKPKYAFAILLLIFAIALSLWVPSLKPDLGGG
jgi:hypothetical protein